MKYLLDTHAILWYLFGSPKLSDKARKLMDSEECFYSYVSFWEISIKQSKGNLDITHSIFEIDEMCKKAKFKSLPVTLSDFSAVRNLPFQTNVRHNDPFDRMLISQAKTNCLTIITCDEKIPLYEIQTVW